MQKVQGIYVILHAASGRRYVGSSANVVARWNRHRLQLHRGVHPNRRLQAAWDASGETAFEFLVVESISAIEHLYDREQYWLDASQPLVYNVGPIVRCPALGAKRSADTRAKLSAAKQGRKLPPFTDDHKQKIRAAMLGKRLSLEVRGKLSAAKRGKPSPKRGHPLTPEHRMNLKAAWVQRKAREAACAL